MDNSKSKYFPREYDAESYLQLKIFNLLLINTHLILLFLELFITQISFWNVLCFENKNMPVIFFIHDFECT